MHLEERTLSLRPNLRKLEHVPLSSEFSQYAGSHLKPPDFHANQQIQLNSLIHPRRLSVKHVHHSCDGNKTLDKNLADTRGSRMYILTHHISPRSMIYPLAVGHNKITYIWLHPSLWNGAVFIEFPIHNGSNFGCSAIRNSAVHDGLGAERAEVHCQIAAASMV